MQTTTTTTTTPTSPMGFRTLTARFAGICRRCNGPIAVGDTIRYGGKGKTYHLATDCRQQLQAQPQAAPTAAPTDHQIMTAAIAESLRQTFGGLMAMPARLGDVEPRVVEAPAPAAVEPEDDGRDNGAPFVDDRDSGDREPDPEPVQAAPVAIAPQKAPRPRQTARRKANVALTMAQPLDPDDLF